MAASILIVDDDTAIRESMQEFIQMSNFDVDTAASAEEAIEILEDKEIDVVITDIMMTGMSGLELTGIIKKNYNTDVIVMTGFCADYSYEEAINKGANDFVFKPIRFEELILRLKRVLNERKLTKDRIQMLEKLKKLAITDGLTNLYNSRYFYSQLELEVDRFRRYNHPLSLLLLDIDHFKQYNDAFGHIEGDKVLVKLGKVIKSCLRRMDTGYRYGGEEFTIILPETGSEEARVVAERVKSTLMEATFSPVPGKEIQITISIGLTEYALNEEIASFVQRADRAMYMSKESGRDQITSLPATPSDQ
ncbi:MAG: diguanylate cyclase [Proteobacteria bacterium]|nr:diguanylate cyclase [Pseudomonadota bacterium]